MRRLPAPLAAAAASATTAVGTGWLGRRRMRQALEAQRADAIARLPRPEKAAEDAIVGVLERRAAPRRLVDATPVTDRVLARLAPGDTALLEEQLEGITAELYAGCDDATRRRITLNFAAAHSIDELLDRAGISDRMPPPDVHAMARGPVAAGGDFKLADLVFDALDHAGISLPEGSRVLDFGASSGRVLRAVAAGRPDLDCIGCDPNADAIAWAADNLPMARFFVSPLRPPLEIADASVDSAYAISIWSHFNAAPAIEWLSEMHRVLRPDGALVMTTHGIDCLTTQLRRGEISRDTASAAATAVLLGRLHFVDIFGPEGDWGVKDEQWGNAYFSLEWLMAQIGDAWAVRLYWPGALDDVQDVVVLQRR